MPDAGFHISPHNPNAEQGGGDLITPTHQTVDVRGPWVVFPAVDCAEAQGQVPLPHAALPMSAIDEIVRAARGIAPDYTGGEGDIRDKINAPARETVEWEDIPVADQAALQTQFPKGGRTRTQYGVTTVPAAGSMATERAFAPPQADEDEAALRQIAAELPLEEPDANGGYSPPADATPDAEDAPAI